MFQDNTLVPWRTVKGNIELQLELRGLNLKDYEEKINNILKSVNLDDFAAKASSDEIVGLIKGISKVAKHLGISVDVGKGYRALVNISEHGGQEVPHLHFHLFGGEKIGKMVQ